MDLISVIVPIYKVEKYLDKCVQSIVTQTYQNLEIILVDDGSPDCCGEMCDAWAMKDSRIRVIHKSNSGLSGARNAGIAEATGKYIGFVDSDDYIAPDMYQLLLERMTTDGSDIAACGVEMVFEDGSPRQMLTHAGCRILDNAQAMEAIIREALLKQPVWYKLYKAELIRDIPFDIGKWHEDVFWSWQVIARAKKVSIFDTPCYYYVQRSGSIMGQQFSEKRLDILEAKCIRQDYLEANMPILAAYGRIDLIFVCLYMGQMALRYMDIEKQQAVFARLEEATKRYRTTLKDCKLLASKQRLWALLGKISLLHTCKLRNWLNIGL